MIVGGAGAAGPIATGEPAGAGGGPITVPADVARSWSAAPVVHAQAPAAHSAGASSPSGLAALKEAKVEAALSDDVYNDTPHPPQGWRVAGADDLKSLGLLPSDLQDPRSHFQARVYEHGEGDGTRYVVAFRGTQNRTDWATDIKQAAGANTGAYADAVAVGRKLARSEADVEFTGHSLGGGLASAAAVAGGKHADTFNAAGLSQATLQAAGGGSARVDAYYVHGEALSTLQDGGDEVLGEALFGYPVDAPSAYGVRHELPAVPPAGKGFFASHSPVDKHGLDWVRTGLDAAIGKAEAAGAH